MKSLNSHISVIISLFVLLFSLQFYIFVKNIIDNYETNISNSYSIVIVSKKDITQKTLEKKVSSVKSLEKLSSQSIVNRLKESLSNENLKEFKIKLPKFYKLVLDKLPNDRELSSIKSKILKVDGVYKVEAFSKTYSQIYKLLVMSKNILAIMTIMIAIIGFLLINKQIKIWKFEHKRRISVMTLFGAPFWMKSMSLYRLVFIDSLIASLMVALIFYFAPSLQIVQKFANEIGLEFSSFSFLLQFGVMFFVSLVGTIISVTVVVLEKKN